jgi:Dna[CI] antecedent, DciA
VKPLKTALQGWEPSASVSGDPLLLIRAEWAAIVGEDVAANSRPAEIARDALLIVTRSSAWSQQLAFLSERILSALQKRTGLELQRLRFRVGRVNESAAAPGRKRTAKGRSRRVDARGATDSLQSAFERFRADVVANERAKAAAGWKECSRCGVRIYPTSGPFCAACENLAVQERDARVARLLFEAPWLGYAGVAPLVEDLTLKDYEAIRLRLLRRWKDVLDRVRRTGGSQLTTRDRMIASSYVLLKSELDPERIAPAVVRDLLGDELHEILYGNENT